MTLRSLWTVKPQTKMKRVRFSNKVTVRFLFESDLYREARCGNWMQIARDRQRFHRRIVATAKLIEWCLKSLHRQKIKRVLFS